MPAMSHKVMAIATLVVMMMSMMTAGRQMMISGFTSTGLAIIIAVVCYRCNIDMCERYCSE